MALLFLEFHPMIKLVTYQGSDSELLMSGAEVGIFKVQWFRYLAIQQGRSKGACVVVYRRFLIIINLDRHWHLMASRELDIPNSYWRSAIIMYSY